jgi:hypothetical protein
MRVVIDLQACQSASRQRGIGRHSFELARAIAAAPGSHEVWLALNAAFPASIAPLRHAFSDLIGKERIAVFATPAASLDTSNGGKPYRRADPRDLLHALHRTSCTWQAFSKGVDDAVASVGTIPRCTRRQRRFTTLSRWRAARACRPRRALAGTSDSLHR